MEEGRGSSPPLPLGVHRVHTRMKEIEEQQRNQWELNTAGQRIGEAVGAAGGVHVGLVARVVTRD